MITLVWRALPLAFLFVIAGVCLPADIVAQCPPPPQTSQLAEGEIGLFFDPLGTETCTEIVAGVVIPLYVVARVPEGGIAEFEIPELLTEALPPGLIILAPASLPPGSPYDPLVVIDACSQARRPDPTICPVARGDLLPISMTQVMVFTPMSGTACFQTACATIAGIVAKPPAYNRCDAGAPDEFAGWDMMCIGFGQAPVPVESSTWGSIKTLYDD